jgi:hypothetical protein
MFHNTGVIWRSIVPVNDTVGPAMSVPSRRTSQAVPRGNTASIEFWKAENQKLRERNQSLHRRLHKYKKYIPFDHQTDIIASFVPYKMINGNSLSFIKVIVMNSHDS